MKAEDGPDDKKHSQEYNVDEDSKGTGSTDKKVKDNKKRYQEPDNEVEDSKETGSTNKKIYEEIYV